MADLINLIIIVTTLVICYFIGNAIEKKHYKSIREREVKLYKNPCINFSKKVINGKKTKKSMLVCGNVVIGCDHFKVFLASLKNIFGGNVSAYESCLDRARREALLRMRESALRLGAKIVVNVKFETINIEPIGGQHQHPKVSVLAYGTAIIYG